MMAAYSKSNFGAVFSKKKTCLSGNYSFLKKGLSFILLCVASVALTLSAEVSAPISVYSALKLIMRHIV